MTIKAILGCSTSIALLATTALANGLPTPPAADLEMAFSDRHKIDISNLRDYFDVSMFQKYASRHACKARGR
jgi:hypothetical protein